MAEGPALVAEIAGTAVPAGGVGIWFLNHAGFALKFAGGTTVYVDPYLSDALERLTRGTPEEHRRNYPPPLEGGDVTNADLVLVSHDHLDHFDPDALRAIARASPKARFVAPHRLRADFAAIGVEGDRYVPADVGPTLTFGEVRVRPTPAAHETLERDADGHHRFLGYVVAAEGVSVWHTGDTVVFPGLLEAVRGEPPSVLIAPINGRDFFRAHVRHIVGNMTYAEAAELAATLGVDLVIPCHFGQHDVNTEDPGRFVDHLARRHRRLRHRILVPGEGMIYHPRLTVG